mmetsp:Transcript_28701/g.69608  ORF Transcript_28701/g.69608 Transcript_28701/m.69608 type:complete len:227 (-) Transcript_28701:267-947(-)
MFELVANCFVMDAPASALAFNVFPNNIPAIEIHVLGSYHGLGVKIPKICVRTKAVNPPANTDTYIFRSMFGYVYWILDVASRPAKMPTPNIHARTHDGFVTPMILCRRILPKKETWTAHRPALQSRDLDNITNFDLYNGITPNDANINDAGTNVLKYPSAAASEEDIDPTEVAAACAALNDRWKIAFNTNDATVIKKIPEPRRFFVDSNDSLWSLFRPFCFFAPFS